ncbi:F-box/LRR-repeat protein At3g48880-like [Apium graveolens]|uniref:F-box/LRR-repeat protein At3g48880-like n=1 Tax=Apium graveolens TaxID=4045 RepID=UPI003D79282A
MKKTTEPQWKDLNPFLLCTIFSRLSLQDQLSCVPFVCHSWLSALLHTLFNHPNLDLSALENLDANGELRERQLSRYTYLLKLAIKHCKNWVSVSLPSRNMLDFGSVMYVAERTPNISRVMVPCDDSVDVFSIFMAVMYWKNLRAIHAPFRGFQFVFQLVDYCKNIEELGLHGRFSERDVACIVAGFPGLKVLDLSSSTLPAVAMRILLDGRLRCIKELNLLHCQFLDLEGKYMRSNYVMFKEFRLQFLDKVSGIKSLKKFMHCMKVSMKKPCEQCALVSLKLKDQ